MSDDGIVLRPGRPHDAAALAAFAARTFAETFATQNGGADMRLHLERAYRVVQQRGELADADMATLLAWNGEALAAYAQVHRHAAPPCVPSPAAVELKRFYVDRPTQGRGLAARLMAAVFDAARAFGANDVWLGV